MESNQQLTRVAAIAGIAVAAVILLQCSKATNPEPSLKNRVYLATDVEVTAGDRFALPVYFENTIDLGAINIPLDYDTSYLRCDSISFIGSRVNNFLIFTYGLSDTTPRILIGAIDSAAGAPPGSGLIANAWFWAFGFDPDTVLEVWSPTSVHAGLNLGFRDTSLTGTPIIPEFEAGKIRVKAQ